jgi:hypothetical protein
MTWNNVKPLANQKTLKDSLLDSKNPETPTMPLDLQLAAKAFTNILILLGKMQEITGIPLTYVAHHILKGSNDADIDDETKDPHPFGQAGSPYFSIDDELIAWAPILFHDLTHYQLSGSLETLLSDEPF